MNNFNTFFLGRLQNSGGSPSLFQSCIVHLDADRGDLALRHDSPSVRKRT